MGKVKVVHYLNQFFAGIGGEEKADTLPHIAESQPPISQQLQKLIEEDAEIVGVVVCGDSYFNENLEEAKAKVLEMIKSFNPDILIAGPAFNAGIKAFSAMYEENPGVDVFKKEVYIIPTADSAAGMRKALPAVAKFATKLAKGEEILSPQEDGYFARGVRVNAFVDERGSMRAVKMLVKKLKGEEFETEYPMPVFDRVAPNPAVKDITKAKIALVTSGGIVPKHNPDHIESSSASKYGRYDISSFDKLSEADHETAHGGYDPTYANNEPDRVLPVDVLRDLEKEGKIGELFKYFYTTVGNGTSVANSKQFAQEFSKELLENKVDAVILTST